MASSGMSSLTPEQKLVVKHTFLEFVDEQGSCGTSRRQRCCTDPCADAAHVNDIVFHSESTSCGSSDDGFDYAQARSVGPRFASMPTTPEFSPLRYPSYSSHPAVLLEDFLPMAFSPEQIAMWQHTASPSWLPMPQDANASCHASYFGAPFEIQDFTSWPGVDHSIKNGRTTLPTIAEKGTPAGLETRTSVMLRGIPQSYTRADVLTLLNAEGFYASCNFVYLPMDFKRQKNLGYALVNLALPADAVRLSSHFQDFSQWKVPCESVCEAAWCDPHQGLEALVERYRNSPVMHESVPEEWRPLLLCHGMPVAFPAPTTKIKCPKLKGKQ